MTVRHLNYLLAPRSVAVIGASDRPCSVGAMVMRNLLAGEFQGPVWPVNTKHAEIAGREAFRSVDKLPATPDLAVICTPAATVPALIAELGARGTRAAIVLSAGLEVDAADAPGHTLNALMLDAARPYGLRIMGPNCLGLLVPRLGLNASFAHVPATPGKLAFVSQSGALTTALLDWAQSARIGFSHFVSLGNSVDVDVADLLNYLANDVHTEAILLYLESITHARKFMSAARAASRRMPVIVVKSGRVTEGARAAASHTGALVGADEVYDVAFQRAGILRVATTQELFDAAEALARIKPPAGERLAIISNGGGPGVMATDALITNGGQLAALEKETFRTLDAVLPASWSHLNPVDLIGDAPVGRYVSALNAVLADAQTDAVLLIHAPTAIVPAREIAEACAPVLAAASKSALACWMGGPTATVGEQVFAAANIAAYSTPESAVKAFLHVVQHRRNQQRLLEVPAASGTERPPDTERARNVIGRALREKRPILTEIEAKEVLTAYGIAVVPTRAARNVDEAESAANSIGYPVALKILSPDITHKSDVGGVALDIDNAQDLRRIAQAMLTRCQERVPTANLTGFTVQRMIERSRAHELIAGITVDPTFGPVALFGEGGTGVEVIADKALSLLPLNRALARDVIARTRISRQLAGYRDRPAANMVSIEYTLIRLSQLAVDLAEVAELDINPLLVDERGAVALDARIRVEPARTSGLERLVIAPYPAQLEQSVAIDGRVVTLRPIRPEDLDQHREFLRHMAPEDLKARFSRAGMLPDIDIAHLTQIDYDREMAFIVEGLTSDGISETLGVARSVRDPDNITATFALLVRSDLQHRGFGDILFDTLARYARSRGTQRFQVEVSRNNATLLRFAASKGMLIQPVSAERVRLIFELQPLAAEVPPPSGGGHGDNGKPARAEGSRARFTPDV